MRALPSNLIPIKVSRSGLWLTLPQGASPLKRASMRGPSERDQCQAKLDILVDGFMRDDAPAYREACAWLRDFADHKNAECGRVMCGGSWFMPKEIEALRERARMRAQNRARQLRPKGNAQRPPADAKPTA